MNAHFESPELIRLFQTYTASDTSIGAHFASAAARSSWRDPLIVATGTDMALFPGAGAPPAIEGYRVSSRGFKEIAAVSHLGPAVSTLARMKELDPDGPWREDARLLLDSTRVARSANSTHLWRTEIGVPTFVGRESAIAAMTDYACRITERVLERALSDDDYLTAANLRRDYLDGPAADLPVPVNRIMVATFFLTGMDLAHRLIGWFDRLDLPWERTMVIVAGRQGRATAGVTLDSNSVAGVISAASRGRLPDRHVLLAPHAPVFPTYDGTNLDRAAALEHDYRLLWSGILATADLGEQMFSGYARFVPRRASLVEVTETTPTVGSLPAVSGPDDWFALTSRLRVVLEDPRQLLSGAVTDYAGKQLVDNDNDPHRVTVPGLDGEPYPGLMAESTPEVALAGAPVNTQYDIARSGTNDPAPREANQ